VELCFRDLSVDHILQTLRFVLFTGKMERIKMKAKDI